MPNSLKIRLKGLVHKGLLSEKDLSRIYTDNDVVEKLEKIKEEFEDRILLNQTVAIQIMDKHISELKGETE